MLSLRAIAGCKARPGKNSRRAIKRDSHLFSQRRPLSRGNKQRKSKSKIKIRKTSKSKRKIKSKNHALGDRLSHSTQMQPCA
jgi:hypothetical protein